MNQLKTILPLILLISLLGVGNTGAEDPWVYLGEPTQQLFTEAPETIYQSKSVSVDNWSRSAVVSLYNDQYLPAFGVPMNWTGSVAGCNAGATSQAYIDATFDVINFFREMVGLPDASNAAASNGICQEAALIMSANGALNHTPPSHWTCYTSGGYTAAYRSNLALGTAGPGAMALYMYDPGSTNYFVGHRRWVLCPYKGSFGTGSVGETTAAANSLYWDTGTVSRPATPVVVSWPPEGYVPYQLIYPRWSFSLNTSSSVSFASATVTMSEGGSPISLSVVSRTNNGYCDNTIVWEPSGITFTPGGPDRTFTVTVSNISGPVTSMTYDVVLMDPAVDTDLIFDDGFESGGFGAWWDVVP